MNILEINNLQVDFMLHGGTVPAVRDVSFAIPRCQTVALVGESGSGKSVTAQSIMRILPSIGRISGGSILLNDPATGDQVDIARLDPTARRMRAIRGGRVSMIFQEPMVSLSPLHTVGDQVSEAVLLHQDVSRDEARRIARDMLHRVGFPHPDRALKTYPFELSGGLRQRAMIAVALVCRPDLLIADEPTTALDVTIQAQILKLINDLQQELDMSVLLITHDLGVVANVADEVVVMYHGEIMERGAVEDIYRRPQHPYLNALLKAVPHFDMKPGERLVPVREIDSTVGTLLQKTHNPNAEPAFSQAISASAATNHLEVAGITRTFTIRNSPLFGATETSTVRAVDDVSFTIQRGECFGLVGESGCGKTTLSKILMKALTPDCGRITYFDKADAVDAHKDAHKIDVLGLEGDALFAFRRRMQFIFQDPFSSLNPRMTVYDLLREPLVIHEIGDDGYQAELVKELMRLVGLDPRFLNRYPHSFSGGQRQRLGIARALALKPDLIICDEPVSALDVSIQAQILNLLKDLRQELQLTTLFISHNLAVVDYIADRIAVMAHGKLVEIAPRQRLFNNPVHPYTRALLKAAPFPDLDRRLDFAAIMDERASDPASWPAPFGSAAGAMAMIAVAEGHHVRQQAAG